MARFNIPQAVYPPHPAGRHQGRIIEVNDLGLVAGQFGEKHKVEIIIESLTADRDDGSPAQVRMRMTLSSNAKASLRAFREAVLDRPLTAEELLDFDGDRELIDRRISYRIDQTEPDQEGRIYGNIRPGSIEPMVDRAANATRAPQAAQDQRPPARSTTGASTRTAPDGSQRSTGGDYRDQAPLPHEDADDSLPFNSPRR